jgi:tetratricopeptide (TPR) repeat protein
VGNVDQRPSLPARLSSAERDFYLELRRLVSAAGLSCRALEESTSVRSDFFSKSQWARWLNGISGPPRNAIRKLIERLAEDEIEAGHLVALWDKAFAPADSPPAGDNGQIRPRQLPVSVQQFIGRTSHLQVLSGFVDQARSSSGPVVIVIEGMAGVGKTALANHLAHSVSDRFPDGQLYVNVRGYDHTVGPMKPGEVLPGFLDALGVAPQSFPVSADDQAALYRSVLAGKHVLIVIDNACDAEQVRRLLPGGPGSLVLVTSRNQLTGLVAEGAHLLRLEPFTSDEARGLLERRLGSDRVQRESQAADELVKLCAGLPLALSVAAAYVATHPDFPLAALTNEFRNRGLDVLDTGDPATTTRSVFSRSYDNLSDHAAPMFRLLGIHPGPDVSLAAAASLTAMPAEQARRAIDELTRAHLLEEYLPGRFTFHALLRAYAAEQAERLDSAADRRAAAHRVLDYYLHTAISASARLRPYHQQLRVDLPRPGVMTTEIADPGEAALWFATEAPVLLALIDYADVTGFDVHAWQIPWTLSVYFIRRGRLPDYLATQTTAVAAASRLGNPVALAHSHYRLAHAQSYRGENEASWQNVQRALALFRELGDRGNEAMALNGVASLLQDQGRHAEALEMALEGLRIVVTTGDLSLQGTLENTAGWTYAQLGEYDVALSHCQRALELEHKSGNSSAAAATLDSIGYIYRQRGDLAQSKIYYQQAIEAYRKTGDPFGEPVALSGLGETLAAMGATAAAREVWLKAEAMLERLSHPLGDQVRAKLAALV